MQTPPNGPRKSGKAGYISGPDDFRPLKVGHLLDWLSPLQGYGLILTMDISHSKHNTHARWTRGGVRRSAWICYEHDGSFYVFDTDPHPNAVTFPLKRVEAFQAVQWVCQQMGVPVPPEPLQKPVSRADGAMSAEVLSLMHQRIVRLERCICLI
jgi:hypothetical protein